CVWSTGCRAPAWRGRRRLPSTKRSSRPPRRIGGVEQPREGNRPPSAQRQDGGDEDLDVEGGRKVAHVEEVVIDPLVEVARLPVVPAHLPQAGDPGPHGEAAHPPGHARLVLAERGRAGPDEAHLS